MYVLEAKVLLKGDPLGHDQRICGDRPYGLRGHRRGWQQRGGYVGVSRISRPRKISITIDLGAENVI